MRTCLIVDLHSLKFKNNGERFEYDFSMINQLAKKTKILELFRLIIRIDPLKKEKKILG